MTYKFEVARHDAIVDVFTYVQMKRSLTHVSYTDVANEINAVYREISTYWRERDRLIDEFTPQEEMILLNTAKSISKCKYERLALDLEKSKKSGS